VNLKWDSLGDWILEGARESSDQVILVSPFIKYKSLERIVNSLKDGIKLSVYTRWRIDEIAQGVSDIATWSLLINRPNSHLHLIQNLHSKYYRFDNSVYVGSANITDAGMTWSRSSNLETLINALVDEDKFGYLEFEGLLKSKSIEVDQALFERTRQLVEQFKRNNQILSTPSIDDILNDGLITPDTIEEIEREFTNSKVWIPVTRSPNILFDVYAGNCDLVSKDVLVGAYLDLSHLEIPPNLDQKSFSSFVASRLEMEPLVIDLDKFLVESRRFGELREFLSNFVASDSTHHWQTVMRWLLYFMPSKYSAHVANYSEIFKKN
jgi:hypothetical protein